MSSALKTQNLTVGYRHRSQTRAVLSDLNLSVAPGELVALLGVNGIGKSTILRTLSRMQPALAGSIEINGADIGAMSQYDLARHIGVVLTERVAIGAMPAYRLVELGRYPHSNWSGLLTADDRQIVADAIAAVGAQNLAHREVDELSDGERQRIMIARALAQRPTVLLLDEPSAFLDVSARVEITAMLGRLARDQGVAIIMSSHDLELSLRTSDTIWLVTKDGQLRSGAPEDLLADGSIAAAFSGPSVTFSAGERSFSIAVQPHGAAYLEGTGDSAAMAKSVLEREGFALTPTPDAALVSITTSPAGWTADAAGTRQSGTTFAALASFLRQLTEKSQPEPR